MFDVSGNESYGVDTNQANPYSFAKVNVVKRYPMLTTSRTKYIYAKNISSQLFMLNVTLTILSR